VLQFVQGVADAGAKNRCAKPGFERASMIERRRGEIGLGLSKRGDEVRACRIEA
jgi:hypothetical protein